MTPEVNDALRKIRHNKPFILTITDYFPMGYVASGIRSIGGFPMMCNSELELMDLLKISGAVSINIGKLNNQFIKLCNHVCKMANQINVPIILDPVGARATRYRTESIIYMLETYHISILRGYPNEIASLLSDELTMQDNIHLIDEKMIIENTKSLSQKYNITVVNSGKRHIVANSDNIAEFNFDSELLQKVAGIGNLLTGIIGAFHSVIKEPFLAAKNSVHFYAECVGPTSSTASGPASLIMEVIDRMYVNATKAQLFT